METIIYAYNKMKKLIQISMVTIIYAYNKIKKLMQMAYAIQMAYVSSPI